MAPKQQKNILLTRREVQETDPGEKIVISGMAGLYPKSHNVKELSDILYNKENPIEKSGRWSCKHPEVSQYVGIIPEVAHFDAQFFKVHYRLCNLMDPMSRKMLEQTYQAIFDAGCNPESLSGKKVGVFVGNCISESEKASFYLLSSKTGLGITGCSRSMFANRISYYLNLKGPSVSIDESCCSSTAALKMAYDAIARGECEAAIVGGANLCLHPQTLVHYGRAIPMCLDGKTKSFDANADGCSKSEAINIIFLQKAKDALRIYAYVVHAKCEFVALPECETGARYGFNRNPEDLTRFLKTFYKEARVLPEEVQYIEAFGAANLDTDKLELDVIDEVFCKERNGPLKVGSVMSNIGYVEAASGTSAITKVLLGYHKGKLAANLHYKTPRDDIDAIKQGRIEILTDHKEFIPTYTAVNGISICGSFSHVLLHGFNKKKDLNKYKSSLARIVLCSGRQETAVEKIFDDLKGRPIDPEEHALLHNFYQKNVAGHLGRGFVILDTNNDNETVSLGEDIVYFDQGKLPLWFVYSGMGSQWVGMGKDLMRIPVFAAAIQRCHQALEPKGLNLTDILTSEDPKTFDNILNSFVGIAAVQIGLTDVLRVMDIVPDNIIGHSVGEIGCAYADGCFTAEETILCAYSRGLVSVQTPFIRGSMAAVGLGYKEISKICPPEIEVACRNSAQSCTISGPADIMSEFVTILTRQGIFAKEVPCSNIAYHSRYIADAGPGLLKYMKQVIQNPKERSSRWLSTSVPQDKWNEPIAKYSSAEYFTNNLLNPVLFEETSQLIPPDAVVLEVAPHGLLQAILKRALPKSCKLLPLTRRDHPDNSIHLLEAVGKLYMKGFLPKVQVLYPKVEFPVSTSTPMLSHLVDWVYDEKWSVPLPTAVTKRTAAASQNVISTYDAEHNYLKGHVIRGRNHYPFSATLVSVWDTLAMSLNLAPKDLSVQFENVYFYSQPILHKKRQLRINISLQRGTGKFEVLNDNSLMVKGTITSTIDDKKEVEDTKTDELHVNSNDIYQLLYAKEYQYSDDFRSIHSANESLTEAQIEWKNNWVTYLDGIIQFNALRRKHSNFSKLNFIRKIVIDVKKHTSIVKTDEKTLINAKILELHDKTTCGGVIVENPKFVDLPKLSQDIIALKTPTVVQRFPTDISSEIQALNAFIQIVADNINADTINVLEFVNDDLHQSDIENIVKSIPGVKANYTKSKLPQKRIETLDNVNLVIVSTLISNEIVCQVLNRVPRHTFVILKTIVAQPITESYNLVCSHNVGYTKLELIIWKPNIPNLCSKLKFRPSKQLSEIETAWGEYYFIPLEETVDSEIGATLKIGQIGDFDSLNWVEAIGNNEFGLDVKVHFAGVNTVFVQKLLGSKHNIMNKCQNNSIIDFSGILTNSGTRVMGLIQSESLSSRIKCRPDFLLPVPSTWTSEDAATVPLSYTLAFYILFIKAKMTENSTILVQGGAGALGQALISIALAQGCEVFTTVSNNVKKQFLLKLFPELKGENVIDNIRDPSFFDDIRYATKGKGCDIIISQAKGQLKNFSLQCLAFNGVLVDTTVIHSQEDYNFGMNYLTRQRSYLPIDITNIFDEKYVEDVNYIRTLMIQGIQRGYVRPLSYVVYGPQDVSKALRLQAACNNRGRVLLDLKQIKLNTPRLTCSSSSWQLLISDIEILTIKVAEKLMEQGARRLILALGNSSKCLDVKLRIWKKEGIEVEFLNAALKNIDLVRVIEHYNNYGSLERILIIAKENTAKLNSIVNNLAAIVSKSDASLKHFALITESHERENVDFGVNGIDKMISKIKLPKISLTYDENIPDEKRGILINDAVNILEKALCSSKKYILAHTCRAQKKTLLEQILHIADLTSESIPANASPDMSLKMLNIDNSKFSAIQSYLRDVYDVCLMVNDIKKLTLESIAILEKSCMEFDFVESNGISSFFPKLHTDELLSTTDIIFLPTLAFTPMYENDINVQETQLCIIPGVEGHYSRFDELCARLKIPALSLQSGLDHPNESISEQANRYVQILTKISAMKNNFYLLGYEMGVVVALEMAAILEQKGLKGTVFCVGGAPAEIITHLKNSLDHYKSDEELQMAVLKYGYSLMTKENPDILDPLCKNLEWSQKVDLCMDKLHGYFPGSIQYTERWINNMYSKLSFFLEKTPEVKKLQSQIISLRPRYVANKDSSLENYSHKPVISYQLEAPLSCAPQDLMCPAIINRHLGDDILEKFDNRNICVTYVLNLGPLMIS